MNRTAHVVPERAADRRVRRTTQALTHAFVDLVREKRYDAITVQDLLERADVGRSTFYAHYRGKDDLLERSFARMLARLDEGLEQDGVRPRVAPVRDLFRHVGAFGSFHRALAQAGMLHRVYEAGTDQLSRTIRARLPAGAVPVVVRAQALAGAVFALLRWWLAHGMSYTPEQMDDMFHASSIEGWGSRT